MLDEYPLTLRRGRTVRAARNSRKLGGGFADDNAGAMIAARLKSVSG
jgi:hypothetical protein